MKIESALTRNVPSKIDNLRVLLGETTAKANDTDKDKLVSLSFARDNNLLGIQPFNL